MAGYTGQPVFAQVRSTPTSTSFDALSSPGADYFWTEQYGGLGTFRGYFRITAGSYYLFKLDSVASMAGGSSTLVVEDG